MLRFNTLLKDAGIDASKTRLLRHRHSVHQRALYKDAINRDPRFESYQAIQVNERVIDQIRGAETLASFVADPVGNTVFVGLWSVRGLKQEFHPDPYSNAERQPQSGICPLRSGA